MITDKEREREQFWNQYFKMKENLHRHQYAWLVRLVDMLKRLKNGRNA